ncbi:type IVB secretion system protein IcmH/DotU [Roseateles koreensis]|uniref:Type IVB secretion system protein IcmH/DotU n=1 Tax=Roseateles koreensis TaxID=2987526 RepID=A0ABT5KT37_9BURK|nr:type IVB secretion system protein IcmH/DotU [Roseateles koreensis]MDC8786103.1 type IVB secretion system protein IcmH/DotU [Roseateles koreensis]
MSLLHTLMQRLKPAAHLQAQHSYGAAFKPVQADSLADIYKDAIYLALDIQRGLNIQAQSQFRERLLHQLDTSGGTALAANYSSDEVDDARYAVAAYFDEAVLNSDNPLREFWQAQPLQLELYKDNRSGIGFFTRLERLRQSPERNFRLLELYNLCLMLGFEGRYRLEGRETLNTISAGLAQEIARLRGNKATQLAPHAVLKERRRAFHLRVSVWLWPLLALLGLFFGARYLNQDLDERAARLAQDSRQLAQQSVHIKPDIQSVLNAMLKGRSIGFESGRDLLTPAGAAFLDTLLPVLQSEPEARVALNGHTDSLGAPASNQRLSLARAQAVQRYLTQHGIAAERLQAEGFGASQPIAPNTTAEGQAQNRRIEFKVLSTRQAAP